jgi:cell wall-associated NlpC family hydrolase
MAGRFSGLAVFYATSGGVLLWSGFKGQTVAATVRAIASGNVTALQAQGPQSVGSPQIQVNPPAASSAPGTMAPGTSDSSIANDALRYIGHPYLWGGAPGPSGTGGWDCSSFANWVLGHDLGMTLPGMSSPGYSGTSHGPTTLSYLAWGQATTVSHTAADALPGDLLVWQTHIGFSLGGDQMVSALGAKWGTVQTTVAGGSPGAEILFVRRIKGATLSLNPGAGAGVIP